MMLKLFSLFMLVLSHAVSHNPGIRPQANQRLLDYAKEIGVNMMNEKIKDLKIPDVSASDGILHFWLTNIKITAFNVPNPQARILVEEPNGIEVKVTGVTASIVGHYKVKIGSGWLAIQKSGDITAEANGAYYDMTIGLSDLEGSPHLLVEKCAASIGELKVKLHGDIIDDILNLFSKQIADYIEKQMNSIICEQVTKLVNEDANEQLAKIPTSLELYQDIELDLSLTQDPFVDGDTIALPMRGLIWYKEDPDDPGYPQPDPISGIPDSHKMICIVTEAEFLFDTATYALQISNLLHISVDRQMLDKAGDFGKYLDCVCEDVCIGKIIPPVQTKCGQNESVIIDIKTSKPATIVVDSTGIAISIYMGLDFKANLSDGSVIPLFSAINSAFAKIPSTLRVDAWKIKGEIHMTGANMVITSSQVGKIDEAGLDQMWKLALLTVVDGELNKVLEAGIALPTIPDLNITKPEIYFGPRTVAMCADLEYTGPTLLN